MAPTHWLPGMKCPGSEADTLHLTCVATVSKTVAIKAQILVQLMSVDHHPQPTRTLH